MSFLYDFEFFFTKKDRIDFYLIIFQMIGIVNKGIR